MNHNPLKIFAAAFLTICSLMNAEAQNRSEARAQSLIAAGRANMAKQTSAGILAAHRNFSDALRASRNNPEANLLFAATLILREHAQRDLQREIQSTGVRVIDPNPYNYQFSYSTDSAGRFLPSRFSGTRRNLTFLRSKDSLRSQALSSLRRITNTNFRTTLTAAETSLLEVTVDYADVLFLRSILLSAGAFQDMTAAHNLEAEYLGIYRLVTEPDPTPQKGLRAFPSAFNLTGQSTRRLAARLQLLQANTDAQAAFAFIKNSRVRGATPNLFEVDDETSAQDTALALQTIARSLSGVQTLPVFGIQDEGSLEGRKLNLSRLFDSRTSPRSLFPTTFERGYVKPGSWSDRTLGGIFPDFTSDDLDFLALSFGILQNTAPEPYKFTTFAGLPGEPGYETQDGIALFGDIAGMAVDSAGNVYVADNYNHVIHKITPAGEVSDFVGKKWNYWNEFNQLWEDYWQRDPGGNTPSGIFQNFGGSMAFDSKGNLFFVADGELYKFHEATGLILFAERELFNWPSHIAIDQNDTIYVCDGSSVLKVTVNGIVSKLAGETWNWGYENGNGSEAEFSYLEGIAVDKNGDIFVADTDNHVIRKITPDGTTTTYAGSQNLGRPFDANLPKARFQEPTSLAFSPDGSLFVVDDELVRKINPQGKVTTIGGKYQIEGRKDGTGEGALFGDPCSTAIAVDSLGRVYVSDETTVRRGTK